LYTFVFSFKHKIIMPKHDSVGATPHEHQRHAADSPLSHCAQQSFNCITAVSRRTMIITTIIHPVDERDGQNIVEKDRTLEIKRERWAQERGGYDREWMKERDGEWCGSGKAPPTETK
jgi:hypothetical protein